jgi:hypothetical protein
VRKTELAKAADLKGWREDNVEVVSRIVAQCKEDLNGGLGMVHLKSDGE